MIVKLSKDCRIRGEDKYQFTLEVRQLVSDRPVGGKVSENAGKMSGWKAVGYHGTLESALKSVLKHAVLAPPGEKFVKHLIEHLDKVIARIEKACEGLLTARAAAQLEGEVCPEELDALFAGDEAEVA